jgi:Spy/CpxP family protein refolding chaperone
MRDFLAACLVAASFGFIATSTSAADSPYVGQEARAIKALSAEDADAYLSGKGMGLAKAAELNGYAGPAHVLELASQLSLTLEQRARTEALFASMQANAIAPGRALVDRERRLDGLFASKTITPQLLAGALAEIGSLQAQVRGAHLQAHLAQIAILTPEQNARYAQLRGYSGIASQRHHEGPHKHKP